MTRILITIACLALAACGGGGGGGDSSDSSQPSTAKTVVAQVSSQYTGQTYALSILVPADYASDSSARPVIYSMDAESRFVPEANALQAMPASISRSILVGISNNGSSRRTIDFEMPGAALYFQFLTLELVPFIDARYRTDPKMRILSGGSLSGLMSVYALLLDTPGNRRFSALMSADGSMWAQPGWLYPLEQKLYDTTHDLPVTLMMAASENYQDNVAFCNQLASRGYTGFDLKFGGYGQGHVGMDLPSFIDHLSYIFKTGGPTGGTLGACGT